jgi:hypothetical protein
MHMEKQKRLAMNLGWFGFRLEAAGTVWTG